MGASKPSPLIPETPADSQQLKGSLRIHLQNQISFAFSCLLLQASLALPAPGMDAPISRGQAPGNHLV